MKNIINCEHCHNHVNLSDAKRYEILDLAKGSVEVHHVCGLSCLTAVFNNHHESDETGKEIYLTQACQGENQVPQSIGLLDG